MIKRISTVLSLALLLWIPAIGQARMEQVVFEKANQLYLDGKFAEARDEYLKIVNSGYQSAELYYNLGNAFYKLGQIPSSILYYEKARLLNPKDEDIRFNLELANRMVVDKINTTNEFFLRKWIRAAAGVLKADLWGIISLVAFSILLASVTYLYASRGGRLRTLVVPAGAVMALILVISLILGTIENRQSVRPDSAIIFTSSLTAKSSPESGGTDLFVLHEGVKVRITGTVGTWIRIRLADGNEGWVPENSVERI